MAEYISREAVLKAFDDDAEGRRYPPDPVDPYAWAKSFVKCIPAADIKPVVHAIWRYKTMSVPGGKGQTYAKWSCTHCKGKSQYRTLYCPNCGAMMEDGA